MNRYTYIFKKQEKFNKKNNQKFQNCYNVVILFKMFIISKSNYDLQKLKYYIYIFI